MKGKWVAIVNGEVAAVGEKNTEVMLEAFQKTGCKVMYLNKVGHEKTALRKRIRQYATGSYNEQIAVMLDCRDDIKNQKAGKPESNVIANLRSNLRKLEG